jgi:hypothetical protein
MRSNFLLREAASKALQQVAAGALKGNHQGHASGQMKTPRKIFLAVAELELAAANLRAGRIAHELIPLLIKRLRTYLPRKSSSQAHKKTSPAAKTDGRCSYAVQLVSAADAADKIKP